MGLKDIFITPLFLLIFLLIAIILRPKVTNANTRAYFLPALLIKFFAALLLGLMYQFYYGGGDTFGYFSHGSKWIWEAFKDNPLTGIGLLLQKGGQHLPDTFEYTSRIWYYRDPTSFLIVRIAAFFDLFTFHTYSATALFFAAFSFSGLWAMYSAIYQKYHGLKYLHIPFLFIPSLVFWGSGILKDSITIGALGWLTWVIFELVENKKRNFWRWVIGLLSVLIILKIKPYIAICFIPTVFVWLFFKNLSKIRNPLIKLMVIPVLVGILGFTAWESSILISTEKYNIDSFAQRAAITAYDIRYGWGARLGGQGGYDLGGLPDGSWQSMVKLMPAAVNVSLFRPYLWEVKNPLMLLSAMEAFVILLLFARLLWKRTFKWVVRDPFLIFCVVFTVLFSFAVGISTYNFGTLMRYKIPMMPFLGMVLISSYPKRRN